MAGLFFLRVYRRLLLASFVLASALWLISAGPFWNVAPGAANGAPQFTVNRLRKGDRMPGPSVWHELSVPQSLPRAQKVPLGCDRAFSPVVAPEARSIYGRCLT